MKKTNLIILLMTMLVIAFNSLAAPPATDTIVVDNNRRLNVNDNTQVTIDRRVVNPSEHRALEQFGTGFYSRTLPGFKAKLNYQTSNNPAENGDLIDVNLINSVLGPVTLNDESGFKVLTVNLFMDADVILEGVESITDIGVGSIVAASGLETEDGNVRVTRLEVLHNGSDYWLITGAVANLAADGFDVSMQHVNTTSETPILCDSDLANDTKVIVDFIAPTTYTLGDALDAESVVCYEDFGNQIDPNVVFFNGNIEQVNADQTQIVVNGKIININAETVIVSETNDTTLAVDKNVSVEGVLDTDTNEVTATTIFIHSNDGNPIDFPVILYGSAANVATDSFTIDTQTISFDANTTYVNGVASDLVDGIYVQVTAIRTADNGLLAQEIVFLDNQSGGDFVSLDGSISNLNADHSQFMLGNETVEVNPSTQYYGTSQADLSEGLVVRVEGIRDAVSGNIVAGFVMNSQGNSGGYVSLTGTIQSINADNSQLILVDGSVVNITANTQYIGGTQADLAVGVRVSITGLSNDNNDEIEAEAIFFDDGVTSPEYVFFLDFINSVADDGSQITVGSHVVLITADTQIIGGSITDLVIGIEVQVDGLVNSDGTITADSITLPLTSVSAFAPVLPADITQSGVDANNGSITIMGIEFKQNDLTFDPMGLFTDGIAAESDITVYGYQDSSGTNWAGFIYLIERGQGTPNNPTGNPMYFVSGQVSDLSDNALKILGVNIGNLDNAVLFDANGQQLNANDFLASLSVGDSVTAADAETYDRATNTLNPTAVYADSSHGSPNGRNKRGTTIKAGAKSVSGSGIITRVITDVLFKSGF